jgi:hypothetical protein
MTRARDYLAGQRRARHLSPHQLAAAVGYTNLAKGANRILAMEREGAAVGPLLDKVIRVLEVDREYVRALVADDRRVFEDAWQQWVDERVEPQLRFRPIAAVWCGAPLPTELSRDEAVQFATRAAVGRGFTYVLVWSRKEEIWCYPNGATFVKIMNPGEAAGPFSRLRGRGQRGFILG